MTKAVADTSIRHGEERRSRVSNHALSLLAALVLTACANPPPLPPAPVPAGPEIALQTTPVPLNPADPAQDRIGAFVYAGGIAITSTATSRLHGLSDFKIQSDGTLIAVSDEGDLFEARLQLDETERLVGLADGKLQALKGIDGQPLQGKEQADAEGLLVMPNGDKLVSFERDHRIWLYPADGSAPRAAPAPKTLFSDNEGMEALSRFPFKGEDAYLVGGEEGEIWLCRLSAACEATPSPALPQLDFGLTAIAAFDGDAIAVVDRAYDPLRGSRILVKVINNPTARKTNPYPVASFALEHPLTRDNVEGLALVRNARGGSRFYLLSDDNFNPGQRTLLMAFDWVPAK
jgi:hypothetical protein